MFFCVTDYTGNYIYKNGVLEFFNHAEGYVEKEDDGYKYTYQYKDHLGNIRLSFSDSDNDGIITTSEIKEEKNYYPFGLQHKGYNNTITGRKHNYGYNGQEEQNELELNTYDYGWRHYDPAIGRFNKIDRYAEKYESHTPYHYTINNPIYFVDVKGDSIKPVIKTRHLQSLDPRKTNSIHDFGITRIRGGETTYGWNEKTQEVDITFTVQTDYSFLLKDDGFNNLNQGLDTEITDHEERHQQQIIESFTADLSFDLNGTTYSGSIDQIATQIAKDGKEIPINKLINLAIQNVISNYPPGTQAPEDDANNSVREKSKDPDNLYIDGKKPINLNYQTEEEKN